MAPSSSCSSSSSDSPNTGDRRGIERITGRPLCQDWPAAALAAGSRVTVVRDPAWDGPWRNEFQGTIDDMAAPEPVRSPHARVG